MIARTMLHVEDDPQNQASLVDAIEKWNDKFKAAGKRLDVIHAASAEAANVAAERSRIDCALLDLRLPEQPDDKPAAQTGRNLVKNLLTSRGIPMAVISGHPKDFDLEASAGGLIKTFDKGDADGYEKAVDWLGQQWQMLQVLADARAAIDQTTSEVFVKRIWPQWQALLDLAGANTGRMATIVSRQYMSHAAELLGTDRPGNEPWHPFESFIIPPVLDHRAHTGDIFEIDGVLWIVLTPPCDMAEDNGGVVLLAQCEVDNGKYNLKLAAFRKNRSNDNATAIRNYVNQNISSANHFLPPLPNSENPTIVNFRELRVIGREDLAGHLANRRASVSMPFLPNLIQRFGAFLTRTGQPNIDVTHF
jgi:CheY-like chemotaxis protein